MHIPVNLTNACGDLESYWSPKVMGQVNDQYVKVAKLKGELTWHCHADEDEMFLVLQGMLRIEFQDTPAVEIRAGEFFVVPKGVMHNPVAVQECWIALIESKSTKHTGDAFISETRSIEEQLVR